MSFGEIPNFIIYLTAGFAIGFLVGFLFLYSWSKNRARSILDKDKTQFIAITSHYLLTPLSIIEGTISHLQEKESTISLKEREEQHEIIKESADRLLRIADQMLLVNRLNDGKLNLNLAAQSLSSITQEVVNKHDRAAKRRGIFIRFIADPHNRYEGQYDGDALRSAINSIIENAIKFSHDGAQVVVLIEEKEGHHLIEVRDQGIGMTAEQLQMAKDKFYRGTPPYQFDYEGIGLGLYVSDVVARSHKGEIIIQSSGKEHGTVVQLVLPK